MLQMATKMAHFTETQPQPKPQPKTKTNSQLWQLVVVNQLFLYYVFIFFIILWPPHCGTYAKAGPGHVIHTFWPGTSIVLGAKTPASSRDALRQL